MPMQVKVIQATEPNKLEELINGWLSDKASIHVDHVTQSQVQHGQSGPMPITVCIWYTIPKYE